MGGREIAGEISTSLAGIFVSVIEPPSMVVWAEYQKNELLKPTLTIGNFCSRFRKSVADGFEELGGPLAKTP
jgi:hypothetical protein